MKIPASASILTLNSKWQLERLLPTLVQHFEDVYIMDGNSTDGTVEYARSLGVRAEKQFDTAAPNQKIADFGAMRERLWSKARFDWTFITDADEELTPEIIEKIRVLVAADAPNEAHRFRILTKLPDGRIVRHALYYPYTLIRLFRRSTGLKLGGRAVHERFIVPDSVRVVDHEEVVLSPQPSSSEWRARQLRYLALEAKEIPSASWRYFWTWIVWYNLRSFVGQLLKAVGSSAVGFLRGETALPWPYSAIFLEYRLRSIWVNGKAWGRKRRESGKR